MAGKKRIVKDHLGNIYASVDEMCAAYGITTRQYYNRRKKESIESALTRKAIKAPNAIPATDHLGITYPSLTAMLKKYNISDVSYKYRLNKGWSLEKTLTTPTMSAAECGSHICKDHLGNEFKSKKDMCDYWRIPRHIFFRRISEGKTLEEALTTPIVYKGPRNMIKDHLGNEYINVDMMCAAHNITKEQYLINIRNNCDIEAALTSKTEKRKHPIDHLGNEYRSINELCKTYGITKTTLRARSELGWTLKDILEHPESHTVKIKMTDHEGNEFETQKDMLEYHNMSYTNYTYRRKKLKMSLAEALSPDSYHTIKCEDHKGNKFESLNDMLAFWMNSTGAYHDRLEKSGNNIRYALTKFPKNNTEISESLFLVKQLSEDYCFVIYKNHKYIMPVDKVYRIMRCDKIDKTFAENNNKFNDIILQKRIDNVYKICYNDNTVLMDVDNLFKIMFLNYLPINPEQ